MPNDAVDMQSNTALRRLKPTEIALLGLIVLGIVANCFFNLAGGQLQDWDEAGHGVTAYEMIESGDFLVNTYNHKPDYSNTTKPPLSFWSVALGYSLFGFNPFGLRFFSALFTCLTLFLTLIFCYKTISTRSTIFTGFVLLSLYKFFQHHNARTGDPDALFLLFNTAGLLIVLFWPKRHAAYRVASFLAGLAFLTKSFHAIPIVLLLFIFFLIDFPLSRQSLKQAVLCVLMALAPVALWGIFRCQFDGTLYFKHIILYDLVKRSTETIEGHVGGPFYYVKFVVGTYWAATLALALALAIILTLRVKTWGMPRLAAIPLHANGKTISKMALAATLPLFLYSLSASKLFWYSYPTFPFLSMLLGIYFERACARIEKQGKVFWGTPLILCVLGIGEICALTSIYAHSVKQDPLHSTMKELGEISDNRHAVLFLDGGDWRPADVLAAKLYGDFRLMPGKVSTHKSAGNKRKIFLLSRADPSIKRIDSEIHGQSAGGEHRRRLPAPSPPPVDGNEQPEQSAANAARQGQ